MSYATYTTEALVCGSHDSYTSDRSYLLFAKEAGMLWATARSVREEKSKQRSALQDFSFVRVSLVKGKSGWRVGSVEALGNPFLSAEDRQTRALVNFVVQQLKRYIHGEGAMHTIFDDTALLLRKTIPTDKIEIAQLLFQIRLLTGLGYVAPHTVFQNIIAVKDIHEAMSVYDPSMEATILKAIETATNTSHL